MKKILGLLAAALLLNACGSGGSGSNSSFTVTAISPNSNTIILPNQQFIATFSSNVNGTTLTNNVTLINQVTLLPVTISCTLATTSSIVCSPSSNLTSGVIYNLNFLSGIQSSSGTSLSPVTYTYVVQQ
ncbi:MAG: Ig-like domain-containing protein [Burkholderiales bacterium]|nr:Ig-like domain-containing protein [Burkholderiales bacterium]